MAIGIDTSIALGDKEASYPMNHADKTKLNFG